MFNYTIRTVGHEASCPAASISGGIRVYDSLIGGTIAAVGDTAICYGDELPNLINVVSGSGGSPRAVYEWRRSETGDPGSFDTIGGATSPDYTTPKYYSDQYFQRLFGRTCGQAASNIIKIVVHPLPAPFELEITPNVGCGIDVGEIRIKHPLDNMVFSINGGAETDNPHFTDLGTRSYTLRARDTKTNCSRDTVIYIPATTANKLEIFSITADSLHCATEKGEELIFTPNYNVRVGSFSYEWKSNRRGVLESNTVADSASLATEIILTDVVPDTTEIITLTLKNLRTGCEHSLSKTITVRPALELLYNRAADTTWTCVESSVTILRVVAPSRPANVGVNFQWFSRPVSGTDYTAISNETNSTYSVSTVNASAYVYRCVVRDNDLVCPADTSAERAVIVLAKPVISSFVGDTVCDSGEVHLRAITPTNGANIVWYDNSGVKLSETASNVDFVDTIHANTSYWAQAQIVRLPSCASVSQEVKAVMMRGHTVLVNNPEQSVCPETSILPVNIVYGGGATDISIDWMRSLEGEGDPYSIACPEGLTVTETSATARISGTVDTVRNVDATYWAIIHTKGNANDVCPSISDTVNILVHLVPTPVVIGGDDEGCDSVVLGFPAGSGDRGTIYWQFSPTGTEKVVSTNPLTVTSSGIYYARAVGNSGCWTDMATKTVTINTSSAITAISKKDSLGIITLTATDNGAATGTTTIYWSTTSNSTDQNNSGTSYTTSVLGTYYARPLSSENCWGKEMAITVSAPCSSKKETDTTFTEICAGESVRLQTSEPSGSSYQWSTGTSGASYTTPALNTTTAYTVTITSPDKSCVFRQNFKVIAEPQPKITKSTDTLEICEIGDKLLNVNLPGGVWSVDNTNSASISSGGHLDAYLAGNATVTYTLGDCFDTLPIIVHATPAYINIDGELCVDETIVAYVEDDVAGGEWSTNTSSFIEIQEIDNVSASIKGAYAGPFDITYTTEHGCSFSHDNLMVNPIPGEITGLPAVGVGATTTLTNSVIGGTWSDDGLGVASIHPATGVVTGIKVGTATITYTLAEGCSKTFSINVVECPAVTLQSGRKDTTLCYRADFENMVLNVSVAAQTSITWTGATPKGLSYNGTTHTLSGILGTPIEPGTFNYVIRTVNPETTCPVVTLSGSIRVYDSLRGGTIAPDGGVDAVCYGNDFPHIGSTIDGSGGRTGAGQQQYKWELSTDGTNFSVISGETNAEYLATVTARTNVYLRRSYGGATCGYAPSNIVKLTAKPLPAAFNLNITDNIGCNGYNVGEVAILSPVSSNLLYSFDAAAETTATSINTLSTGWHSIRARDVVSGCYRDTTFEVKSTVDGILTITDLTSDLGTQLCATSKGTAMKLTATYTRKSGEITHEWSSNRRGIIEKYTRPTGTPGVITETYSTFAPDSTETYTLNIHNVRTGCSASRSITIHVRPALDLLYDTASSTEEICVDGVAPTIHITPPIGRGSGVSYEWLRRETSTSTYQIIGGALGSSYMVPTGVASEYAYRCVVQDNDRLCPADTSVEKIVKVLAKPVITSVTGDSVCDAGEVLLRATSNGSGVVWYRDQHRAYKLGVSGNGADFSRTISGDSTYFVEAVSMPGCVSASLTEVKAFVFRSHTLLINNKTQDICPGTDSRRFSQIDISFGGGASGFAPITWAFSDTYTPISPISTPNGLSVSGSAQIYITGSINTFSEYASKYYGYVSTVENNSVCPPKKDTIVIDVDQVPSPVSIVGDASGCGSVEISAAPGSGAGGMCYWQSTSSGTDRANFAAGARAITTSGTYFIRAYSGNGCWTASAMKTVTIHNTDPVAGITVNGARLTATGIAPGLMVYWSTAPNSTDQSKSGTDYDAPGSGTYYARTYNPNTGCWGASVGTTISVVPQYCTGITISLGNHLFATSQTWKIGNQEWSDAVKMSGCNKNDFNAGYNRMFEASCRQSNNGFDGHYFSWCAVMMYAGQLCPNGWRVPTMDDYITLDRSLGGNGTNGQGDWDGQALITNTYIGTTGTFASCQNRGGQWGGARFTGFAQNGGITHSSTNSTGYWTSTNNNNDNAHAMEIREMWQGLRVFPRGVLGENNKQRGYPVRCVRDLP